MSVLEKIPGFRKELLSEPYVQFLHGELNTLANRYEELVKQVDELKDEIRRLKKLPKKPRIKPSNLDKDPKGEKHKKGRRKTGKRKKKENLEIHQTKEVPIKDIPEDWNLMGYKKCVIQGLIVQANNIE